MHPRMQQQLAQSITDDRIATAARARAAREEPRPERRIPRLSIPRIITGLPRIGARAAARR